MTDKINALAQYLLERGIKQAEFARMIDETPTNVNRYIKGERIPDTSPMQKIFIATKGKIDANSFYGIDRRARRVSE